jgi:hypothetical protein
MIGSVGIAYLVLKSMQAHVDTFRWQTVFLFQSASFALKKILNIYHCVADTVTFDTKSKLIYSSKFDS